VNGSEVEPNPTLPFNDDDFNGSSILREALRDRRLLAQ
jgi:hypothetical protein